MWDAKLVNDPRHPLPFLSLWSDEQDICGKSAYHRSLSLLFNPGAVDVHAALEERFNGQLAGRGVGLHRRKTNQSRWLPKTQIVDRRPVYLH